MARKAAAKKPKDQTNVSILLTERTVACQFNNGGKLFHYLTDDPTIQIGDQAIVEDGAGDVTVVTVRGIAPGRVQPAHKWIIQKVDLAAYELKKEKEAKRQTIRKQLVDRMKAVDEEQKMKLYAEQDPEFAKLYNELQAL